MAEFDIEPGAARDSVLIASGSFDNFEQMSSSLEEIITENAVSSREDLNLIGAQAENGEESSKEQNGVEPEEDIENSVEWTSKKKHIFVLSTAGKPIYCR